MLSAETTAAAIRKNRVDVGVCCMSGSFTLLTGESVRRKRSAWWCGIECRVELEIRPEAGASVGL